MANFNLNEAENYGGNGGNYFSLKDDGDSAVVRFMYNTLDDIIGYAVHKIKVDDNNSRFVNCLRNYDDPFDNCPLCNARNFQIAKFYFNLYDMSTEEVRLWDRGKTILKNLVPVLSQIKGPICGTPIKVTRHGKAGDQYTKYSFELLSPDDVTLEDLPEPIDPNENIILSYTKEELEKYISTGSLPNFEVQKNNSNNDNANNNSIRRRYASRENRRTGTGNDKAF